MLQAFSLAVFLLLVAAPTSADAKYAALVLDADTGAVLHETNADTRNYPASLTKMMTLYLAFEALESGKWTTATRLPVSKRAAGMPPSKLGLKAGSSITVKDAVLALVTKSANDVAVVVAESLGGTEIGFAKIMTEKAKALGMARTTFKNASGLPNSGQLSTARDMATLGLRLLQDFPERYRYFSTRDFSYNGATHRNHNRILKSYEGADGIKTGYIRASGFNLVASAVRNGRRVIAVVFGGKTSRSRDAQVVRLLDRGFEAIRIADAKNPPNLKVASEVAILSATPTSSPVAATGEPTSLLVDPKGAIASASLGVGSVSEETLQVAEGDADHDQGEFAAQVGAFSRYEPAHAAALAAAGRLAEISSAQAIVTQLSSDKKTLYRARLASFSETQARAVCARLIQDHVPCIVVRVTGEQVAVSAR